MDAALEQIGAVVALALVIVATGGGTLVVANWHRTLVPCFVPVAASVVAVVVNGVALAIAMTFELSMGWLCALLAVYAVVSWVLAAFLERERVAQDPNARSRWLTRIPWAVRALALIVAAVGATVGGVISRGDALFHIAVIQKLAAADALDFNTARMFADGDAHPAYVLPALHGMFAVAARISGTDPLTVWWVAPTILAPLALLSAAGLGRQLFRTPYAAILAAVVWLCVRALPRMPYFGSIGLIQISGTTVTEIVLPLAVGMLVAAVWAADGFARTHARVVLAFAIAAVAMLHVSYLLFLAFAAAGYALGWLAAGPLSRDVVRRTVGAGAVLAIAAIVAIGAMSPVLSRLAEFSPNDSEQVRLAALAWFGKVDVFVGTVDGFHLRLDYLVRWGGALLLALACAPLALFIRRFPAAWYIAGTTGLVIAIAASDFAFPLLVEHASAPQASRLMNALPLIAAGTLGLLLAARAGDAMVTPRTTRRGLTIDRRAGRGLAVAYGAALATGIALVIENVPPLLKRSSAPVIDEWLIAAIGALCIGGLALISVRRMIRARRSSHLAAPGVAEARLQLPPIPVTRSGVVVAVIALLIGMSPLLRPAAISLSDTAQTRALTPAKAGVLRAISPSIADELRDLPASAVVMSPQSLGLHVQALAPLRTVSVPTAQVARTTANTQRDRAAITNTFFTTRLSPEERVRVLKTERVDAILAPDDPDNSLVRWLESSDNWSLAARGGGALLYVTS